MRLGAALYFDSVVPIFFWAEAGVATRYTYGTIMLEKFHQIKLSELSSRPRARRLSCYGDELLGSATSWPTILAGHTYIVVDATGARMLACFPFGMEDTLGVSVVDTVRTNMKSFVEACLPKLPNNARFTAARQWLAENAHISNIGMFEWAVRQEQGHSGAQPAILKDTAAGGGVQKLPLVRQLLTSLGNVTRSIHVLFGAVDRDFRNSYAKVFTKVPIDYRRYFSTDMTGAMNKRPCEKDIFSYRALVNLWTRPHRDTCDWNEGWAWIVSFGDFSGDDFCVTELPPSNTLSCRRRFRTAWWRSGALDYAVVGQ